MTFAPSNRLVWFGVLGGALAWAAQFVVNLAFTFAECTQPQRWMLPVHSWEIGISAVALAIGVAAMTVSVWMFRHTYRVDDVLSQELQGEGSSPPLGRILFLSVIGLALNSLTMLIIIMTAVGAPLLAVCQQS